VLRRRTETAWGVTPDGPILRPLTPISEEPPAWPSFAVLYEWPDGLYPNLLRPCRLVQLAFGRLEVQLHYDGAGWQPLGPDDTGIAEELAADLARQLREANSALLGMQT
jgi:hypothetical protein